MNSEIAIMADIPDIPPAPRWFTKEELAARWRKPLSAIKRMRQQGKIPSDLFGKRDFRFPVKEILEIEKNGGIFQRIIADPARKPKTKPK
jgi:hypothetical protein